MKTYLLIIVHAAIFVILGSSIQTVNAQSQYSPPPIIWQKCTGGSLSDFSTCMIELSDGSILVGGSTLSNDYDMSQNPFGHFPNVTDRQCAYISKHTKDGHLIEIKYFQNIRLIYKIIQTSDGGFALVGITDSLKIKSSPHLGGIDILLVKVDAQFNQLWENTFGGTNGDQSYDFIQTRDNGFLVLGSTFSNDYDAIGNKGSADILAIKTDSVGQKEWSKTYGGSNIDHGIAVVQTVDDGYLFASTTRSEDGDVLGFHAHNLVTPQNDDAWLIKTTAQGNIQWNKCYGGINRDVPTKIHLNGPELTMIGHTSSIDGDLTNIPTSYQSPGTNADFWILRMNSANGSIIWQKRLGSGGQEYASNSSMTNDTCFLITGYILTGSLERGDVQDSVLEDPTIVQTDVWSIKVNNKGDLLWEGCYGSSKNDIGANIITTLDKSVVFCGSVQLDDYDVSQYHGGSNDTWLVKIYDSSTSKNISVQELSILNNASIQPNPVIEEALLNYTLSHPEMIDIDIFHLNGQHIAHYQQQGKNGNNQLRIATNHYVPGLYYVSLKTKFNQKVLKLQKY